MPANSFDAQATLEVGERSYEIFRLDALQASYDVARLPFSLKVLLENLLRNEDGEAVTSEQVETLAQWNAKAEPSEEIAFTPARVLMQDFTCPRWWTWPRCATRSRRWAATRTRSIPWSQRSS
jgi:aconitate hydratase